MLIKKSLVGIKKRMLSAGLAVMMVSGAWALAAEKELVPMGCTVGIQMNMEGVLVVGLSDIQTADGEQSPSRHAGIVPGDVIKRLDDTEIKTADDFVAFIAGLTSDEVTISVLRNDKDYEFKVKPAQSKEGTYQLGLWLRDSVTGIGTVTFYDPDSGMYGALGHSISDAETGILVPLGDGEILDSTVVEVKKGECGNPGELCGYFDSKHSRGDIILNTDCGIFGVVYDGDQMADRLADALPVASEDEIQLGKASILANVDGKEVCEYEIEVGRVYKNEDSGRCLMLTVTDSRLLEQTGGIVQGMSGSPIIQNGKLIGAVTHVLVSDPTKGYGISIEKMLELTENPENRQAA